MDRPAATRLSSILHIAPADGHAFIALTNRFDGLGVHNGLICEWYEELAGVRRPEFCWVFDG